MPLVEKIMDKAGQKGTGKWTMMSALELGMPVTLISEALFSRYLSNQKEIRVIASEILSGPKVCKYNGDKNEFIKDIAKALYASKIVSYAQGFMLMREAANEYKWELNFGDIALLWRAGCIIRSKFLEKIKEAFDNNDSLPNLLLDSFFCKVLQNAQDSWRHVISQGVLLGIPLPTFSSALSFYDGFRCSRLPANLLQAQRDYFGAHTYELLNQPGKHVHSNWSGSGGAVSSTFYNA